MMTNGLVGIVVDQDYIDRDEGENWRCLSTNDNC